MESQIPSSDSGSNSPPSPATTAPLTTELYAFDTLLLTFLGRNAALPPAPLSTPASAPTISLSDAISSSPSLSAQTNPQEQLRLIETTAHVAAAATDADSAADIAQKAHAQTTPFASPILSATSDQPPSLALPNLITPPSSSLSSSTIPTSGSGINTNVNSANTDNNAGGSYPNLPSWLELLSPSPAPPPLGSGMTSTSNTSNGSNDFIGRKSTVVRNGAGEQGGGTGGGTGTGRGGGGGGVRVRGGITLAYQACQMLPEPIHLRYVNTTLLPFTTTSPDINGHSNSIGVGSGQDSYAIEYFADQGCTQFMMATAGTRVNVWQAELNLVESNAEKDPGNSGGDRRHSRRRGLRDDSFIRIGKRQLLPSPATVSLPTITAATATYTPWTPAPTTKQALNELDMVVSVRWIGILKRSEFTMSKALLASHRPSPNRVVVDPLLERRGDEDSDGNGGDEEDEEDLDHISNIGDNNNTNPPTTESVTEQDRKKEFEQGAIGSNTPLPALSPIPHTPTPTPALGLLQDGKNPSEANVDGVGGFVSWTSFNETQLQAPPRRDLGSFLLDDMVYNIALRGTISPTDGKRNTTASSTGTGTGHFGMPHTTSQIVMAGLIAGLLLILGSLLTAVYYRQRRRKWYEEDGEV